MQTDKRQYYGSDLSYILGLGQIVDMHVVTLDNGVQVLRIESMPVQKDEYKTVKAAKPAKKPAAKKAKQPQEPRERRTDNPATLGDKLMSGAKTWFAKKDKPQFMRDAGY